jgi:hypothetical protein
MAPVHKLSAMGSLTTNKIDYPSMLAGNPVFNPTSYDSIATVTVGSGGASSIDFTSIPSTYTHLQIREITRSDFAGIATVQMQFNGDTGNNYSFHTLYGDGSFAGGTGASGISITVLADNPGTTVAANVFDAAVIDILDYANINKNKTLRSLQGYDANGSGIVRLNSGLWNNTSAISSIKLLSGGSSNFTQYSSFALYGIKGA